MTKKKPSRPPLCGQNKQFGILNLGYCDLFDIWDLVLGIFLN